MASGVRKLAANLAYARRAAKRLGLGEVASSISRVLQAVVEQEAKLAASHVATQTDTSMEVFRSEACVATQTELTSDASAAPPLNDMALDYELEAREIASFMDEMECDSEDGDVDAAVPCSQTANSVVEEEDAHLSMTPFSDQWLQYYLGMLETDSARLTAPTLDGLITDVRHRLQDMRRSSAGFSTDSEECDHKQKNCITLMRVLLRYRQDMLSNS